MGVTLTVSIITYLVVVISIIYLVVFFPAMRTAIAFWLYRDKDDTARNAMRHGFFIGFISIWLIYPIYIIKDCFSKGK